jgi:two-component system chemotaxis sensor kinase CheA
MTSMFAGLRKIAFKLALLAGVPLIGALLLAAEIQRGARDRAEIADAIGSIEDLAVLSARMADTVDELQTERAAGALLLGLQSAPSPELAARDAAEAALIAQETKTDAAVRAMDAFLAQRDIERLPSRLRTDLVHAHLGLQRAQLGRAQIALATATIAGLLETYGSTNADLIDATAGLTQLSNDGEMLRALSSLVEIMQVQECDSREHAILSHTFAKGEFAPGSYRYLVTLVTERGVHEASLRSVATPDQVESYQRLAGHPGWVQSAAMLARALDATEDNFDIPASSWFETQQTKVLDLAAAADEQAQSIRQIARSKVNETRRAVRYSESLAVGVVLVSILLAVGIGRRITSSVLSLAKVAGRVQMEKDFSLRAVKTSRDELGTLTDAFNEMLAGIQSRDRELLEHRENLEQSIADRTYTLWQRTEQMSLVLDTVDVGLATLDKRGRICAERSRAFDAFFGPGATSRPYFEHIAGGNVQLALALELDWAQISEGNMPLEVALRQARDKIQIGDAHFALSYKPILDGEQVNGALLTVRDVTRDRMARHAEAIQREQIKVVVRVMKDRAGFLDFFNEAQGLVESIENAQFASAADKLRAVHTLKGNAALADVESVAEAAHALEKAIADGEAGGEESAARALSSTWGVFVAGILPILDNDLRERYEVSRVELDAMLRALREGRSSDTERLLTNIQGETVGKHFDRAADQLRDLSQRLGKGELEILIGGAEIRLAPVRFASFWWAFAHVVRNVAAHALQSRKQRELAGKPPSNRVLLSARLEADAVVIDVAEDGRGIDWSKVAERAIERNWPHQTRADLVEAVFAPGFSTAETISEISGRGVGMSAVLEACRALDGECAIDSEAGQGTRLTFTLPLWDARPVPSKARSSAAPKIAPHAEAGEAPRPSSIQMFWADRQ